MTTLVGKNAPDFTCPVVTGDGELIDDWTLSQATAGKYVALVFYPLDFTFVCPSELIALDKRVAALKERGVEVVSVSVDSQFTHLAWRNTKVENGGIGEVRFTMAADVKHEVCRAYGVESSEGVAFRSTVVIDRDGVVRSQLVNDLPLGRNMDELIRTVDALQFHEENGEVCPAGWNKGDEGMTPDPKGVARYLSENAGRL